MNGCQVGACIVLACGASSAQPLFLLPTPWYVVMRQWFLAVLKAGSWAVLSENPVPVGPLPKILVAVMGLKLQLSCFVTYCRHFRQVPYKFWLCFLIKIIHMVECHLSYFQIFKWLDLETNECVKEIGAVNFWRLMYNILSVISVCLPRYFCELQSFINPSSRSSMDKKKKILPQRNAGL